MIFCLISQLSIKLTKEMVKFLENAKVLWVLQIWIIKCIQCDVGHRMKVQTNEIKVQKYKQMGWVQIMKLADVYVTLSNLWWHLPKKKRYTLVL